MIFIKWLLTFLLILNQVNANEIRIISIGASITEILAHLGLEENIVARDTTSRRPESILKAADLGQAHHLSTEAVLAHRPSIVIMSSALANIQLKNDLDRLGVKTIIIEDGKKLKDIPKKVRTIAKHVNRLEIAKQITASLPSLDISGGTNTSPLKLAFLYARSPQHTFMAGEETIAHTMINELGHLNAFAGMQGFKPISAESLIKANPDVILIQESSKNNINEILRIPGLQITQAYRQQSIIFVDTLAFLGLSLQTIDELNRISRILNESN